MRICFFCINVYNKVLVLKGRRKYRKKYIPAHSIHSHYHLLPSILILISHSMNFYSQFILSIRISLYPLPFLFPFPFPSLPFPFPPFSFPFSLFPLPFPPFPFQFPPFQSFPFPPFSVPSSFPTFTFTFQFPLPFPFPFPSPSNHNHIQFKWSNVWRVCNCNDV